MPTDVCRSYSGTGYNTGMGTRYVMLLILLALCGCGEKPAPNPMALADAKESQDDFDRSYLIPPPHETLVRDRGYRVIVLKVLEGSP